MQRAPRFCGHAPRSRPSLSKRYCVNCHKHYAKFCYRGVVKADRDHTLCQQCYQAIRDRNRTRVPWFLPHAAC